MIRPVNAATDYAAIADIYNKYIADTTVSFETATLTELQMRQRIESIAKDYPYFVYEDEGKVLGFSYVHRWKERAAYSHTLETTIYLEPDIKHNGVGTALMQHIIEECRKLGIHVLIACITGENTESIEFHRKLGFTKVSHFHNVGKKFGRWLDVVDMEMQL